MSKTGRGKGGGVPHGDRIAEREEVFLLIRKGKRNRYKETKNTPI